MQIDRIELFHVAIPLPKPFYPSWIPGYPQTENRFTLLRLTTDDGVQGLAAGVAFEREREGLGGLVGPYLIGLDPTDVATVRQRFREVSYLGWRNYWMEAAFWDICGKVEGKSVWMLLAGRKPAARRCTPPRARSIRPNSGPKRCSGCVKWASRRSSCGCTALTRLRTWPRWRPCAARWVTTWGSVWTPTRVGEWR